MKNPFVYGKVIKNKESLCPRQKEEKVLVNNIDSNQNTYVIGERRVGKTSLVSNVLEDLNKNKNFLFIDVDFRSVSSESDAQKRILQGTLNAAKNIRDWDWFLSLFSKLKPVATPNDEGKVEFSISLNQSSYLESLSLLETFDLIKETGKRNKNKLVVFFDEFPDILKMENGESILGQMRTKIQKQDVPYVFAGSHRGEMRNIFENPDNKYQFYKSASALPLSKFNEKDIGSFCSKKFELVEKNLTEHVFSEIYQRTNGITGDIYEVCHEIWDNLNEYKTIQFESVTKALDEISSRKSEMFSILVNKMSKSQKKVLRGIVLSKGKNIYSADFVKEHKLKKKDEVLAVVRSFYKDNILYKKDNKDFFYDPFFYHWLNKIYNT